MKKTVKILIGLVLIVGFISITSVVSPVADPPENSGNPGDPGNGGTPGLQNDGIIRGILSPIGENDFTSGFEIDIHCQMSSSLII